MLPPTRDVDRFAIAAQRYYIGQNQSIGRDVGKPQHALCTRPESSHRFISNPNDPTGVGSGKWAVIYLKSNKRHRHWRMQRASLVINKRGNLVPMVRKGELPKSLGAKCRV